MSDNSLVLSEIKDELINQPLENLQEMYEDHFGELPVNKGTQDIANDQALLVRKLAYSILLRRYDDAGEEVPARTMTFAQKAFDTPFKPKGKGGVRQGTIQQLIVDRLWDCLSTGERPSTEELALEVVAAFPNSTYKNAPIQRMKVDIQKFNKGVFKYAQEAGKVPADDVRFTPNDPAAAEKTDEASE